METCVFYRSLFLGKLFVQIEVFPERDGNLLVRERDEKDSYVVRMKVFPERDGNHLSGQKRLSAILHSPNEGLP